MTRLIPYSWALSIAWMHASASLCSHLVHGQYGQLQTQQHLPPCHEGRSLSHHQNIILIIPAAGVSDTWRAFLGVVSFAAKNSLYSHAARLICQVICSMFIARSSMRGLFLAVQQVHRVALPKLLLCTSCFRISSSMTFFGSCKSAHVSLHCWKPHPLHIYL